MSGSSAFALRNAKPATASAFSLRRIELAPHGRVPNGAARDARGRCLRSGEFAVWGWAATATPARRTAAADAKRLDRQMGRGH